IDIPAEIPTVSATEQAILAGEMMMPVGSGGMENGKRNETIVLSEEFFLTCHFKKQIAKITLSSR
nr:hypothetical protein [Tanacetum cinerariifolium]